MRGYLGITCHYISLPVPTPGRDLSTYTTQVPALKSALLHMKRFKGSHTGHNVANAFNAVVEKFDIGRSLHHFINDNAANMRKAFAIHFASVEEDSNHHVPDESVGVDSNSQTVDIAADSDIIDDPDSWESLHEDEISVVDDMVRSSSKGERLLCFNHSLQSQLTFSCF